MTLTPKPLPGVRVLAGSAQTGPMIVTGAYGAGCVTLTAYDPTTKPFQNPNFAAPALWQTLLTAGQTLPSSFLSHVAAREENYSTGYYYGGNEQTLLSEAVMRAPSLDAPGTEVIGLFLLVYLIALVPVNYLVLKRLDRKEMAWITIPALVLIFALGTFGVGYAAKGGAVFVNRAAILETSAGQSQAGVYSELGLFSPHRASYDITLPGANALAAIPNPGFSYGNRNNGAETQSYGQTRFVEANEGASLQDAAINMWAMRAFDAQSTTDMGGTIDGVLQPKPGPPLPGNLTSWGITGSITNHTSYDLSECAIVYNGQWQQLGSLAKGASLPVAINTPTAVNSPQTGLQIPTLTGRIDKDDPQSDISQRMRVALADYARSLGQQNNNGYYYNGGQAQAPAAYSPASGEALLIGWSNDPALSGPAPRIDGHSVKENDVTLVVIHLPVKGAQVMPVAPPPPPPVGFPWPARPGQFQPLFPPQQAVASASAKFGVIARTSSVYEQAMDAHNFALARQRMGQTASLRGTVIQVYQSRNNKLLKLDFDPNYRRALTVAVRREYFSQFPNMNALPLKEVVVTGVVSTDSDGSPNIYLTQPQQIQVVH